MSGRKRDLCCSLLVPLFFFLFFRNSFSQQFISNKTGGTYQWVVQPQSEGVPQPPYPKTPTILLSTYPSSGSTFVWKVWELARGIGAEAVFQEFGFLTPDNLTYSGPPRGGKLDIFFTNFQTLSQINRVKDMTRKELQELVRLALPQDPVIVKNHHPIIPAKIEDFFQIRSVLGVISIHREDVLKSCSNRFPRYCKITNEEFHKTWVDICQQHGVPLVIYPYSDLVGSSFLVFRDMFNKFVPFENILDRNVTWAIDHAGKNPVPFFPKPPKPPRPRRGRGRKGKKQMTKNQTQHHITK